MPKLRILDPFDMMDAEIEGFTKSDLTKMAQEVNDPLLTKDDSRRLLDSEFGIVLVLPNGDKLRKFPAANKSITNASIKAFNANHGKLPDEAKRILAHRLYRAALRYDIEPGDLIEQLISSTTSDGLYYPVTPDIMPMIIDLGPDDEFAVREDDVLSKGSNYAITHDIHGNPMPKFLINTKTQLQRQLRHFEKQAFQWYTAYAVQMAENLVKRAADLNYEIDEDSNTRLFTSKEFSKTAHINLDARISKLTQKPQAQAHYFEIKAKVAARDCTPQQLAVMLEKADRDNKLHFYWSSRQSKRGGLFQHPAEAMMAMPEKTAEESMDLQGVSVNIKQFTDLLNERPDIFAGHFSEEEIQGMKDDPDGALKSMPAPQREIILTLMGENQ